MQPAPARSPSIRRLLLNWRVFMDAHGFEAQKTISAQVASVLKEVAVDLCSYLDRVLPSLAENWWRDLVIRTLSYQQQRAVDQRKISSLSRLDLAALLRILDQNWYGIAEKNSLTSESRHYVKEMRSVRDRWAHTTVEE